MNDNLISQKAAIDTIGEVPTYNDGMVFEALSHAQRDVALLPAVDAVPVVRCKDCKHNPKLEWFGCPMASLSEKQRPETAWCWKGERKDGDRHD